MDDCDHEILRALLLEVYREHLDVNGSYRHYKTVCRVCAFLDRHHDDLSYHLPFDEAQWRSRQDSVEILDVRWHGPITEAQHRQNEMWRAIYAPLIDQQLRSVPIFRQLTDDHH